MKKYIIVGILIGFLLLLCIFLRGPIVFGGEELSQEYLEAIESQSKGLYSRRLPLLPVWITVDRQEPGRVYYSIHYFPMGTVGMSYTERDGYNIEKSLMGIQ